MKFSIRPIIGLEVHIELNTDSKMFCACKNAHFGAKPNIYTCPVCLGLPGALPVPNKKAIDFVVMAGLALGCEVPLLSKFDRKNYFYPDLPKGYQISQYDEPLAINGVLKIADATKEKEVRIRRVHLEEDTAKLAHMVVAGEKSSLIDFNRSGVPLMEVVTEPDIVSSQEAKWFLQRLQLTIRYLGIADADMEKGQMRCEPTVNLEIIKEGKTSFTPLVEIKNINSFRFAQKAIDYEIKRQAEEFEKTGEEKSDTNKTTRGWSEKNNGTFLQRQKEEASDYRYFPEPDIPPIKWTNKDIEKIKSLMPETSDDRRKRFIKNYQTAQNLADILLQKKETSDYFESVVRIQEKEGRPIEEIQGTARMIVNKKIDIGKTSPQELVDIIKAQKKEGMFLSGNELESIANDLITKNPKIAQDYKNGKTGGLMFLVGQAMKNNPGKIDPQKFKEVIEKIINSNF